MSAIFGAWILVLLACVQGASSVVRCYECQSILNSDCALTGKKLEAANLPITEDCASCLKTTTSSIFGSLSLVVRSCSLGDLKTCNLILGNGACYCNTDLCNAQTRKTGSWSLMVLACTLTAVVLRCLFT